MLRKKRNGISCKSTKRPGAIRSCKRERFSEEFYEINKCEEKKETEFRVKALSILVKDMKVVDVVKRKKETIIIIPYYLYVTRIIIIIMG